MRHDRIDWRRLLSHMDPHWEVLLVHLLNYRWAYPSERQNLPRWLMDELIARSVAEAVSEALRLENAMRAVRSEQAVVVLHYAPILGTVEGEPLEIFRSWAAHV